MKFPLSVIWLIFAVLFFLLGLSYWVDSGKRIPPFKVAQRAFQKPNSGIYANVDVAGTSLDQPLKDFARNFNKYLSDQNESSSNANKRAAWGYFLASLTALFSIVLEWREYLSILFKKLRGRAA